MNANPIKRIGIIVALYLAIVAGALFGSRLKTTSSSETTSLRISASFYQLAYLAQNVGGEYVSVTTVVPGTTEPHEYEPTPSDLRSIHESALFIYNGNGLDPWADKVAEDYSSTILSKRMTDVTPPLRAGDPHIWLDPLRVIDETTALKETLVTLDPVHADGYEANATRLIVRLTALDQAYRSGLATCRLHEIVTAHDAFGYLAERYGISAHAIAGLSPEQEPSPRVLASLTELVRTHHIQYVFFESLTPSTYAETVAREAGVKTLSFNPIEGLTPADSARGATYETLMSENLQNLRTALECQ